MTDHTRISRDELFMATAKLFALRSTCNRGQVGAIIVRNKHIIAHGYNGAPAGMDHCTDNECEVPECRCGAVLRDPTHAAWCPANLGCQRAVHGEANAVAYAARVGVSCVGTVMYSTHEPCLKCAQLIIQAGIAAVYYEKPYRLGRADLLDQAHVVVEQLA